MPNDTDELSHSNVYPVFPPATIASSFPLGGLHCVWSDNLVMVTAGNVICNVIVALTGAEEHPF